MTGEYAIASNSVGFVVISDAPAPAAICTETIDPSQFYSRMQGVALRLLTKYTSGAVCVRVDVVTEGDSVFDPRVVASTGTTVAGYVRGMQQIEAQRVELASAELVAILPANEIARVPAEASAVIDGVAHDIIKVETIPPVGTPVLHKLYLVA